MRKHAADLAISGVLAVLGLSMAIYSVSYRILVEGGRIGPGFMPFVAGLALTAFAVWAAAETAVRARRAQQREQAGPLATEQAEPAAAAGGPTPAQPDPTRAAPPTRHWLRAGSLGRKVVIVFALILGATLLTPLTGFLVAFGLLVLVLLAVVEREPLWLAAVVTVIAVAVSWLVFVRLLGVPLPGGVFGLLGVS